MFCEGDLRKYVELAEEALKLKKDNPIQAFDGLNRVKELMDEQINDILDGEIWNEDKECMKTLFKLNKDYYRTSILDARFQNEWYNPLMKRNRTWLMVSDIRRYLDDWSVFFEQKMLAVAAGKPKLENLDDLLSFKPSYELVCPNPDCHEEIITSVSREICTADLLAADLLTAIDNERPLLVEEAYVRGFVDKKQKEAYMDSIYRQTDEIEEVNNQPHFSISEEKARKMYNAANVVKWFPSTVDEDEWMLRLAGKLPKDSQGKPSNEPILFKGLNQIYYIAKNWIYSPECNMTNEQWDLVKTIFRAKKGDINNVNLRSKPPKGFEIFEKEMKK